PGPGRHHAEHGVAGPPVFDHAVDHLVHGAVAADRDQEALAALDGLAGGLGGVARMGGPHDPVVEALAAQDPLDPGQRLLDLAAAGARVGDEHQRAEGAGHGRRPFGFMMPAGSRAALTLSSRAVPAGPSSPLRYFALRRPTPWWWVTVPPASAQACAA